MKRPDTEKMLERINILRLAIVVAQENGENARWIAVRNSWADLCELFTHQPMTKVIIFEEKHGNAYYDASTKERLWKAMYEVIKGRNELGYWYSHYTDDIPESPDKPTTPLEDADKAEEPVAEAIRGMWSKYTRKLREIDEQKGGNAALEKALASEGKDASVKWFLDQYDCGEYSTYSVETISEVEV